jgi:hypothetical protein
MIIMAKDLTGLAWDIWYVANKTYVATELCVNKAKPEMHCNGKCHLAKQLQKLEEYEPKTSAKEKAPVPKPSKTREIGWIAVIPSMKDQNEQLLPALKNANGWMESNETLRAYTSDIFHPPAA